MWRLYLTNAWLMLMTVLAFPYLLLFFWLKNNTSFLMYIYAFVAQKISGIRIELLGRENMPVGPAVYVFNHQSSLDGMALGMLRIPRLAIIGKKEIVYIPFIGWTFWLAGNVLLNRADGRKARGQLDAGIEAIRKRRASIAIFPEGTRNRSPTGPQVAGEEEEKEGFLPFKRGGFSMAIEADVPVVPVVIESFKRVYDKRARRMRKGVVRVQVLPRIAVQGFNPRNAQQLADKAQSAMEIRFKAMT